MTIAVLLRDALAENSGVSSKVSTRIYPLLLPENNPTLPAITYQRISNTATNGSTALRETRWQISCWAKRSEGISGYKAAQELAASVKSALEEYRDTSETPGIKQAYVVNENDDYDDEARVYRTIVDVMLVTTGD